MRAAAGQAIGELHIRQVKRGFLPGIRVALLNRASQLIITCQAIVAQLPAVVAGVEVGDGDDRPVIAAEGVAIIDVEVHAAVAAGFIGAAGVAPLGRGAHFPRGTVLPPGTASF